MSVVIFIMYLALNMVGSSINKSIKTNGERNKQRDFNSHLLNFT